MPKCVVKSCKNYTLKVQKKDGISYFHFPKNEIQREKWRCIIARDRAEAFYKPNASSVVCSNHFCEDDMYMTEKKFRRLKKTALPTIQASTSATTSQQRHARKKRKGSLPEAKTIVKSVFNYLQTEYENFKTYTGGSCDLSPLENILGRTAAATGVSEEEVKAICEEEDSDDSSHESSSKRARESHDYYDENISPIEEDSNGESADEAQPDNIESTIETAENPIETLKVEIDENVEYHSKPNTGISFQTPLSREQMSVLHQSLSLTEPTHAEVKLEPADVEEQQQMSVLHQSSVTEPTHAEIKLEPADVEEQQYSPFQIIGDIAIEPHNNRTEVDDEYLTIHHVQRPRQAIEVRSKKKPPKTPAERAREFRARQALLKQRSKQQQEPDPIVEIATEDIQSAGMSQKQAKSAAQRMREYRKRKKLRLKQLKLSTGAEDTGGQQDPLGESVKADQHRVSKMQDKTIVDKLRFENDTDEYEIDAARRISSDVGHTSCGPVKEEICFVTEDQHGDSESMSAVHHLLQSNFEATSESVKVECQDTEYPSSPTTQVRRRRN